MLTLRPFFPKDYGRRIVPQKVQPLLLSLRLSLPLILAHMLDSLVRVTRRGKENHFASITKY
eukprot:UN28497